VESNKYQISLKKPVNYVNKIYLIFAFLLHSSINIKDYLDNKGDIMEDIIVQSAMAEIAMWDAFHTGRGANATGLLALILGFWVAARFSSVSLEKNVNLFGKITGNSEIIKRLTQSLTVDSAKIKLDLNWSPPVQSDKGIEKTVNWYNRSLLDNNNS